MKRRQIILAAAISIFAAQAVFSHMLRRAPFLPSPPPLASLLFTMDGWTQTGEESIAPDALEMLGPDDFVARLYSNPSTPVEAELFVAYYKTQLRAKNAHDPKVCLPGAGWNPIASHLSRVSSGDGKSFPVNYYRIKKDDSERVVLYWFQTFKGVYTFDQQLQAHRAWDAVFDNRTDMALVRITVPVLAFGTEAADQAATRFAETVYRRMLEHFPKS